MKMRDFPSFGRRLVSRSFFLDRGLMLNAAVGQRFIVVASCVIFAILALELYEKDWMRTALMVLLCLMAPVEKLYSVVNLIAVERDWVVVIAEGGSQHLETLNSQMRRIDLACKLLGPLSIAFLDSISTVTAIYFVLLTNVASVVLEYFAIAQVYRAVPRLQKGRDIGIGSSDHSMPKSRWKYCNSRFVQWSKGFRVYASHPSFLPSISLSLLHLTVLSFSGQMVTYLLSMGFASDSIGLMRTASVVFELSATWLTPFVTKRVGPMRTGLWSINWQMMSLLSAGLLFWAQKTPRVAALELVIGVILSRVGLWGFDLSVQFIIQEVSKIFQARPMWRALKCGPVC